MKFDCSQHAVYDCDSLTRDINVSFLRMTNLKEDDFHVVFQENIVEMGADLFSFSCTKDNPFSVVLAKEYKFEEHPSEDPPLTGMKRVSGCSCMHDDKVV